MDNSTNMMVIFFALLAISCLSAGSIFGGLVMIIVALLISTESIKATEAEVVTEDKKEDSWGAHDSFSARDTFDGRDTFGYHDV